MRGTNTRSVGSVESDELTATLSQNGTQGHVIICNAQGDIGMWNVWVSVSVEQ